MLQDIQKNNISQEKNTGFILHFLLILFLFLFYIIIYFYNLIFLIFMSFFSIKSEIILLD